MDLGRSTDRASCRRPWVAALLLAVATAAACGGQSPTAPSLPFTLTGIVAGLATVSGVASDADSGAPISGADVAVTAGPDTGRVTTTDGGGHFRLDRLRPAAIIIETVAPGFLTISHKLVAGEGDTLHVVLERVEAAVTTGGRVVDVLSGAALAHVTITGNGVTAAPSDAMGAFEISAGSSSAERHPVELASPKAVPRRVYVLVPDADTELSLIPTTFNLTAFDAMLRDPMLRRWRAAPPLLIERQTLQLSTVDMVDGVALDDRMSDEELQSLLTDLRWALPSLTGDTLTAFGRVTERATAPGKTSRLLTTGSITVVRVEGLEEATGTWGWSRWLFEHDGTVIGGVMMLDLASDRSDNRYRRALRAHELGHTLGYAHVSTAPSVMNPNARLEPTTFDRNATRIAFARQPGNVAPDFESEPMARPSRLGTATWSRPMR